MTELIDLSTLASLGQHFANLEDVAELRASLLMVQRDLSHIKNFLANQFGDDFDPDGDLSNYEDVEQVFSTGKRNSIQVGTGQHTQRFTSAKVSNSRPQTQNQNRSLKPPPPLQRFTVISSASAANGSGASSNKVTNRFISASKASSGNGAANGNGRFGAGGTEKFHRNFLSMGSLKKQATTSTSAGVKNSGGAAVETLRKLNRNLNVKVEPQKMVSTQEEAYYVDGAENYVESEEAAFIEQEEVYDEGGENVEMDEGEMKFDASGYEAYEEDGNEEYLGQDDDGIIYEESYEGEETDMIDPNEMHDTEYSTPQVSSRVRTTINGSRPNTSAKKAEQRRISMPASIPSGASADDPTFLKNCKICHVDIPSYALFNHVIGDHYNGEVPTCNICNKTFTYKQGLISHMRYHDAQKYDKACSYCGKRFIRRSDVIIHERRLHTGERPYLCPAPQCNQGFVRRYCLLTHVKTNHGEPYMSQVKAQSGRRKSS